MDPYSFLNTAHTAYFAELYDQYLINPESVEPSWRAFFQGFEFGVDKVEKGELHIPENILKEFKVVKLLMDIEQEAICLLGLTLLEIEEHISQL